MNTPVRILEVTATLKRGGAERLIVSLASALHPPRYELGVVSLYESFPGGLEESLCKMGVPVWHLGKWPGPDPRMYTRLSRVVRSFKPDVIHTHCYVTRYTFHLRARARVHTVHNIANLEVGPVGRLFHRLAFRDGVVPVAVGEAVAGSVRNLYDLPAVRSIPNGIDTKQFWHPIKRSAWRQRHGFDDTDILITSVARLEPQKNPSALVRVMAGVPNAQLLLVGAGPERSRLEGHERVHLLGTRDDIPDILAASDIFVLASRWEGLPLAILEAMAAGLPVVATNVGSVPEVVHNGFSGLLVPPDDDIALTTALNELASNPDLRRGMGVYGRQRVESFSLETMADAYSDLFEHLLRTPITAA